MASLKVKYAAMIIGSLLAGGLIAVTAWQYIYAAEKQKIPRRNERCFSGMTR